MKKSICFLLICLIVLAIGLMIGCTTPTLPEPTESETQPEKPTDSTEEETKPEMTLEEIMESLRGKYVSILGDSISTYDGVSNVGTTNTTIDGYNAYYNGDRKNALSSTSETYWGMVMDKYQMKLLVNNSCGGNRLLNDSGTGGAVSAGYLRIENLAADTGDLNGTKPDIILLYMGTNDCNAKVLLGELNEDSYDAVIRGDDYVTPYTFTDAYIITLEKATKLYPDAKIFVFTMLPSHYNKDWSFLHAFNNRIRQLANHYDNVVLVDIAAYSGITTDNYSQYTFDGTHPNQRGFAAIAEDFEKALLSSFN